MLLLGWAIFMFVRLCSGQVFHREGSRAMSALRAPGGLLKLLKMFLMKR
jgi:hypothetical protein